MGEIIFLSVFFVISIFLYTLTGDFRISKMDTSGGAAIFPRLVIILLCFCILCRIIQIMIQKQRQEFVWRELFEKSRLFFVVCLVSYVVLLKPMGYILATSAFLIAVVNRLYYLQKQGYGKGPEIVVRNVLLVFFVLAMYFAFSGMLSVNLPKGILS